MKKKYIFRWKEGGLEVWPFRGNSPEKVWEWAVENLRGATE